MPLFVCIKCHAMNTMGKVFQPDGDPYVLCERCATAHAVEFRAGHHVAIGPYRGSRPASSEPLDTIGQ